MLVISNKYFQNTHKASIHSLCKVLQTVCFFDSQESACTGNNAKTVPLTVVGKKKKT